MTPNNTVGAGARCKGGWHHCSSGVRSPDDMLRRAQRLAEICSPLPGCVPHENRRPIRVSGVFDGWRLLPFLCARFPHLQENYWNAAIDESQLVYRGAAVSPHMAVAGGMVLEHVRQGVVEPPVNAAVGFCYEDDDLLVLDKPAPLPMHPSGRFNRNTLVSLLKEAFNDLEPRPVHRLDANTTGLVVLAKNRAAARSLTRQFEARTIRKSYLCATATQPGFDRIQCDLSIARGPVEAGTRRLAQSSEGIVPAQTTFVVRGKHVNGHWVLEARPLSGRTNQIRLHLSALGLPIIGDSAYGKGADLSNGLSGDSPISLHSHRIELEHPSTRARLCFWTDRPAWA